MRERFEINEPTVVSDIIDEMAVIINLENGAYYSGSDTAAHTWGAVIAGASADELATTFSAPVAELREFIDQLVHEGLVRPRTTAAIAVAVEWRVTVPYSRPVLERFDDLEDLLLLDPVHDVSPQGWPHRPAE